MRHDIAIYRAAHLHIYLGFLREVGAPVARDLARSRLPTWIEDTPDEYISLPLSLDWARTCGRDFQPMELGCLASARLNPRTIAAPLQRQLALAQTGFAGLQALVRAVEAEDSILRLSMRAEDDAIRVTVALAGVRDHVMLCLTEWQHIRAILLFAGALPGRGVPPRELTFLSRSEAPATVLERWQDTRILTGQPQTSVLLDRERLAGLVADHPTNRSPEGSQRASLAGDDEEIQVWTFAKAVRALVRPYVRDGYPDLATAAEIAGISRRTLLRRLQEDGRSYSDVVQEARFDLARSLLCDDTLRMIDIAIMCSYENPQHFSRAFRRIAGVSPRRYRKMLEAARDANPPRGAPHGQPLASTPCVA